MSAPVTTEGTTGALIREHWARLLTRVYQSWLRRDLVWALLPALLAAVVAGR